MWRNFISTSSNVKIFSRAVIDYSNDPFDANSLYVVKGNVEERNPSRNVYSVTVEGMEIFLDQ